MASEGDSIGHDDDISQANDTEDDRPESPIFVPTAQSVKHLCLQTPRPSTYVKVCDV